MVKEREVTLVKVQGEEDDAYTLCAYAMRMRMRAHTATRKMDGRSDRRVL